MSSTCYIVSACPLSSTIMSAKDQLNISCPLLVCPYVQRQTWPVPDPAPCTSKHAARLQDPLVHRWRSFSWCGGARLDLLHVLVVRPVLVLLGTDVLLWRLRSLLRVVGGGLFAMHEVEVDVEAEAGSCGAVRDTYPRLAVVGAGSHYCCLLPSLQGSLAILKLAPRALSAVLALLFQLLQGFDPVWGPRRSTLRRSLAL